MLTEKCNKAGIPFQIGCSHDSPIVSKGRVRRAKELNRLAVQVILPDWSIPSDPEIFSFLREIIEEANPMGVVLYNPPHAKRVLSTREYQELLDRGIKISGCKTGGGNNQWYAAMKSLTSRLSVF